ncbi:FAD-containing monooxygenase EthA [Paraconexibacter sp. AEG42_29]|uniref:FAD-containing monooxygenase EthA n=1 Tax=Paraconexibacter sp. AEG42_29 TaxID=2997339 RepID=A0AAU7AYQ3_9ACTN
MTTSSPEHVDVLIVGAGLSGIGAACRLQELCPGKSFALLEARDVIGGTWDQFRYPGVRSDSDMYSLGFAFRPWTGRNAIGEGEEILQYIRDTATEHDVERHIRFGRRVTAAAWSSATARWTLTVERAADGGTEQMTCGFVHWAVGYYHYDAGHLPEFPGSERFGGTVIHPQHWPADTDVTGKRVVVIGSGATAVTLVPALAQVAEHVTMLQRSPTYIISYPKVDPLARPLLRLLPDRVAHGFLRWKNVAFTAGTYAMSRRWPKASARAFIWQAKVQLPRGYDVKRHFTPKYNPWTQRLCLVPNGDLFRSIRRQEASVVTDTIETFTEDGIRLASGEELRADVIVAATGLRLLPFGGARLEVDGAPIELEDHVLYKGMMLDRVPNLTLAIGYSNASFTLKCDLTTRYACRLIAHLDDVGLRACVPSEPDGDVAREPALDLSSGFVQRGIGQFPRQGDQAPWRLRQSYPRDLRELLHQPLEDGVMSFR